jgi:hypothetical protein
VGLKTEELSDLLGILCAQCLRLTRHSERLNLKDGIIFDKMDRVRLDHCAGNDLQELGDALPGILEEEGIVVRASPKTGNIEKAPWRGIR